jgi:hypothetical protein
MIVVLLVAVPAFAVSENTNLVITSGVPAPILGALDADDFTYNRQTGDCSGLSGVGTAVFYDTVSITNNSGGPINFVVFTSDQGNPGACTAGDTFVTAYTPSFNPADPVTNCVTSNDDGGTGLCSQITYSVPQGDTSVIVVTSFSNGSTFDYQVNFDGTVVIPPPLTPVPTMNEWGMIIFMVLAGFGAIYVLRRKMRTV